MAPTGLSAQSPTVQAPLLTWSAVNDADHYDVWRDGHKVDSSVSTNFTDSGAGGGSHVYYVIAVSRFNLSSDPSNVIIVVYDSTPPILGASTWAANPLQQGQTTTLSIPVSDGESDVASVQYAVNGSTPQAMAHDFGSNTWQATFGSSLTASMYNITIIATDLAGNTTITTEILAVYNPSNGYVAGHVKTLPTTSDKLPIALDTSNNPAKLVVGFTNVMAPTSGSFDVGYVVKKNKNEFSINSTAISWVVVQDSTHASILGHADLTTYVNGVQTVTQNVSVRFEIVLGTSGAPDHVTVKIYNPGADPNIGLPAYTISDDVIANGSHLMIHP